MHHMMLTTKIPTLCLHSPLIRNPLSVSCPYSITWMHLTMHLRPYLSRRNAHYGHVIRPLVTRRITVSGLTGTGTTKNGFSVTASATALSMPAKYTCNILTHHVGKHSLIQSHHNGLLSEIRSLGVTESLNNTQYRNKLVTVDWDPSHSGFLHQGASSPTRGERGGNCSQSPCWAVPGAVKHTTSSYSIRRKKLCYILIV